MTDYVPQDLVNAFVKSVARHFRALESAHDLKRSLEAKVVSPGGVQRVRPEDIGSRFFMLTLTLNGPTFSVSVSYGDREHDLTCRIHCKSHKEAYALWEWLEVLGRNELLEDSGGWVLTEPRVEAVLRQFDQVLERLAPVFADADPAIEQQLEHRREERMRLAQQQLAEAEHRRLAAKAAQAFHRQDYAAVVDALLAVRVELTASEKAKLSYAKRKLSH